MGNRIEFILVWFVFVFTLCGVLGISYETHKTHEENIVLARELSKVKSEAAETDAELSREIDQLNILLAQLAESDVWLSETGAELSENVEALRAEYYTDYNAFLKGFVEHDRVLREIVGVLSGAVADEEEGSVE